MANTIDWGKIYETTNFGSGRTDNTIDWGITYKDLGGGAATTPLLDDYGDAVIAYSLRKLSSTYTGDAIQVTPDGATFTDIGFDSNGDLDTASLPSDSDLYVSKWYNQLGVSAKDMFISSFASMPKIKSGGSVVEVNGKPAVDFATGKMFAINFNDRVLIPSKNLTYSLVVDSNTDFAAGNREYFMQGSSSSEGRFYYNSATRIQIQSGGQTWYFNNTSYSPALDDPNIWIVTHGDAGGNVKLYQNGTQPATSATTITGTGTHNVWKLTSTVSIHVTTSKIQEYVLWDVDYDSSASDLNTAINNYYGTYS